MTFVIPSDARDDFEVHFTHGEHAAEVAVFLREAVPPGVLFDVGANDGLFSLLFCGAHRANRSFAYEPSPFFADRAVAIARMNQLEQRIEIVRRAVADGAGTRDLLVGELSGRVQTPPFSGTDCNGWVKPPASATTLDLEAVRVGPPSLVKIDVEGYEWEVLQGAGEMLERARPVVMLALHLNFLEERGIAATSVTRLLTRNGYDLFDLSNRRLSESRLARSWASVMHVIARPRR